MKRISDRVRKLGIIGIALLCLLIGLVTVGTPLPTGVPLLALGILLLVGVSATARRMLRAGRRRSGALDRSLVFVETRAHRNMGTMLKRTRPLARKAQAKATMQPPRAPLPVQPGTGEG